MEKRKPESLIPGNEAVKNILILCTAALLILLIWSQYKKPDKILLPSDFSEKPVSELEFTAEEKMFISAHNSIITAVDPDWEPYEKLDPGGIYTGIAADLISLISTRTGLNFEVLQTKDWKESIEASQNGRAEVLAFLNKTPEREKWLIFTEPYFTDPNVFITRNEFGFISDPAGLTGMKLVLPEGTSVEEIIRRNYPNLTVITTASEAEALKLLENRKADMTLRSLTMAAYQIRKEGLFNLKISGQLPDYSNSFRMGISSGNIILKNILNKGISTIGPQDVQQAVNKHIALIIRNGLDYRILFKIILTFAVVVLIGLYWTQKEKQNAWHLRTIIDAVPAYIFARDNNGKFILANKAAAEVYGVKPEKMLGKTDSDFGAPEELNQKYLKTDRTVIESGKPLFIPEQQVLRKDKSMGWFQTTKTPYRRPGFNKKAVLGVSIDITDRKEAELKLEESEKLYRLIAENSADVIWILDLETLNFLYVSPSVERLRGYTAEEVLSQPVENALTEESMQLIRKLLQDNIKKFISGITETYVTELEQPCRNGTTVWTEATTRCSRDEKTRHLILYGVSRDITERRHKDEKILHMAQYDGLTDLPNRELFFDRLKTAVNLSARESRQLALIFIDLDGFKPVNDKFGHAYGDLVLKITAQRIAGVIRASDSAGRIGGDEFVIFLRNIESSDAAVKVAEKLRINIEEPILIEGNTIKISASLGLSLFPEDSKEESMLIKKADTAMYYAKKNGKNRIQLYSAEID